MGFLGTTGEYTLKPEHRIINHKSQTLSPSLAYTYIYIYEYLYWASSGGPLIEPISQVGLFFVDSLNSCCTRFGVLPLQFFTSWPAFALNTPR